MSEMNDQPHPEASGPNPLQAALISACEQLLAGVKSGKIRGLCGVQVTGPGQFAPFTIGPAAFPMEYFAGCSIIASSFVDVWKSQISAHVAGQASLMRASEGDLAVLDRVLNKHRQ